MKKAVVILLIGFFLFSFNNNLVLKEKIIKNFILKSSDNNKISLKNYKDAKGFIIVFTCNKCPMAKLYSNKLNALNIKYKTQGVYLLAINSMDTVAYKEESFKLMQKKVIIEQINFPYLQDKSQTVAKQFGASHTPQAYIIWKNNLDKWTVKYEGSIDDSAIEPSNTNNYLTTATDQLLADKTVLKPYTRSVGCRIFFRGEKQEMD